jgi:ribosomal-protein-alanine N-acetyltransferase
MLARIQQLELIEIRADGAPKGDLRSLSEFAVDACARTAAHYKRTGFSLPWISFLARCGSDIVGVCAFTAAPSDGRVEIAYHTFPPFEGRGMATAMVRELIRCARGADPDVELFAHTLAERNASNAILRKLGFEFVGQRRHCQEGEIWEWRHGSITGPCSERLPEPRSHFHHD